METAGAASVNYLKLRAGLDKYGRDKLYAYVSDSFHPEWRRLPKFQQWKRLLDRAIFRAMTPREREICQSMLVVKMNFLKELHSHA